MTDLEKRRIAEMRAEENSYAAMRKASTDTVNMDLLSAQDRANMSPAQAGEGPTVLVKPDTLVLNGCTISLRFAQKADPGIRREVADILIGALYKEA